MMLGRVIKLCCCCCCCCCYYLTCLPSGLTPAHVATKEASIEVLKYLFQMGANKNVSVRSDPLVKRRHPAL